MTLLAETTEGMHNLFRLSSRASMEGFFYKPRADRELLAEYAEGLIGTTGCPSGEVQTWLRIGDYDKARAGGRRLPGHPRQGQLLPRADGPRALHRDPGARRPAAAEQGPRHPADRDQRLPLRPPARTPPAHEHLLCVSSGSTMADPKRFRFNGDSYYIKSPRRCASCGASATACPRPATTPC